MAAHSSYSETIPARAGSLAAAGKSDRQIARELGITDRTLRRWELRYPALRHALSEGQAIAAERKRGFHEQTEAVGFYGEEPVVISLEHFVPLGPRGSAGMTGANL